MSTEEFKRMMLGEFKCDSRKHTLEERLQKYYTDTPSSMSNRYAMVKWKEFKNWCEINGYTKGEINKAKKARHYDMK